MVVDIWGIKTKTISAATVEELKCKLAEEGCDVGDYDYAVELALRVDDVETAKLVVEKVNELGDDDDDGGGGRGGDGAWDVNNNGRKRRLWRKIARGVIERGFGVKASEEDIQREKLEIKARMREAAKVAARVAKEARDGGRGANEEELCAWDPDDPDDWVIDEDGMRITDKGNKVDPFPVSRHEAEAGAVSKAANASPTAADPVARAAVIKRALALVPDSEGVLTVEDLLPYFPDFTVIDEFKDAVLEELGKYSKRIEDSRAEIDKATALANQIRSEIAEIRQRTIRLQWDEPCAKCGGIITLPPQGFSSFAVQGQDPEEVAAASPLSQFYAFPCGMAFHTTCLIEAGLPWMSVRQRRRCLDLMAVVQPPLTRKLKKMCKKLAGKEKERERGGAAAGGSSEVLADKGKAIEQLEDLLCDECPFCGEMMLRQISAPLIDVDDPDDAEEAKSWEITPQSSSL